MYRSCIHRRRSSSYRYSDPFSTSEKKKVSSFAETFKYLYREDSLAYIGIDKDVFPGAPKDKNYS